MLVLKEATSIGTSLKCSISLTIQSWLIYLLWVRTTANKRAMIKSLSRVFVNLFFSIYFIAITINYRQLPNKCNRSRHKKKFSQMQPLYWLTLKKK